MTSAKKRQTRKFPIGKHIEPIRDAIFTWWMSHGRIIADTAKEFKISRSTVYRLIKRDDWIRRADEIDAKTKAAIDKEIVKKQIDNLDYARSILKTELQAYVKSVKKGTVPNIVGLMRYIDERVGDIPTDPKTGATVNNVQNYVTYNQFGKEPTIAERNRRVANIIATLEDGNSES